VQSNKALTVWQQCRQHCKPHYLRPASVSICQIPFDSVRFSISSTRFSFFGFSFHTSQQWRYTQWV